MNVLVACESSGRVRDAFRARGHNAWSCDLLPCDADPRYHYQMNVLEVLSSTNLIGGIPGIQLPKQWDLMIAHPPCTYLCNSGVRWLYEPVGTRYRALVKSRWASMREAQGFFMTLWMSKIPRICIENPISHKHAALPPYTQIIQPWQFGHGETKATCLWLKGLPLLKPTRIVKGRVGRIHMMPSGPNRWKERSKTYKGIAAAMAKQWGI